LSVRVSAGATVTESAVVGVVADNLHLELFPAEDGLFDQHFVGRRGFEATADDLFEFLAVVGDPSTSAAQSEGGPDDGGEASSGEGGAGFFHGMGDRGAGRLDADFSHGVAEFQPVLGAIDDVGAGTDQFDPVPFQRAIGGEFHRGVERGLAAHGGE
jgi:hypothetical protein